MSRIARPLKPDPLDAHLAQSARLQDAWHEGKPIPDLVPDHAGRAHKA
jgi:hypothetical protein